ncbi:MAG: sigma-70 family RNA polymerase sigma factor [Acidobacteria bacterium]|nr:sigma-70 family RNA polymerase sigma factor [Acidobacteriota bacterium]
MPRHVWRRNPSAASSRQTARIAKARTTGAGDSARPALNICQAWAEVEARISDLAPSWPFTKVGESPFEAAARTQTEQRLEPALGRLTLRDREVLLLVAVGGMTPSEAASVLGPESGALRKRLQRARETGRSRRVHAAIRRVSGFE